MSKVRCPICERGMDSGGPKEWPHWPFCSERCKLIDLGRWLSGAYRVEAPLSAEDLEDAPELDSPPKPAAPSAVRDRDEA